MAAKVEIFVVPGKKVNALQLSFIKKTLDGKSFPMTVPEAKLKPNDEIYSRSEVADMIVELLTRKALDLKNVQKVIVKTSQFKGVPDDCIVTMELDGAKDGDIKTTIKLDKVKAKQSDPTVRAGYKPAKLEGEFSLEGEEIYAGVDLKDVLIMANPRYGITVRAVGPALAGATWGKLGTATQFMLDGAAKRIGAATGKSVQALEKMITEQEGDDAEKEVATLNKIVSAEINKIQPMVMKALEAQKGKLKTSDSNIERCEFEAAAIARFIKFMPAPDLQAMLAVFGPSKNDKQVGPLTKKRKKLLAELKDDKAERKSYAAEVVAFLGGLARKEDASGFLAKAKKGSKSFADHLAGFKEALENMTDCVETVKKNNKKEKPAGAQVAKEDKVDWAVAMKMTEKLERLLVSLSQAMINAKGFAEQVEQLFDAGDAKDKAKVAEVATKLNAKLKSIPDDGVDGTELKNFKKWSEELLDYIKE